MSQKIIPHLWFDKEAKEAAEFYVDAFGKDSKILSSTVLKDTPSGDTEFLTFELLGQQFMAISAGPLFKINPSISFFVNFDPLNDSNAKENLTKLWEKLSEGGEALMELGEYPFSKYFGWIKDKYGVSWQLILTDAEGEPRPNIIPSLMFVGEVAGKAKEATDFYISIFADKDGSASGRKDSKRGLIAYYPAGMEPEKEGNVMFTDFRLEGQWFSANDSSNQHEFQFNEAISLLVNCENQEEIDYFWEKLSAVPEAEQCGWLKDKYGVSWQISPADMNDMMAKGTPDQIERVTQAFLQMKKFDIAKLREAYNG